MSLALQYIARKASLICFLQLPQHTATIPPNNTIPSIFTLHTAECKVQTEFS